MQFRIIIERDGVKHLETVSSATITRKSEALAFAQDYAKGFTTNGKVIDVEGEFLPEVTETKPSRNKK